MTAPPPPLSQMFLPRILRRKASSISPAILIMVIALPYFWVTLRLRRELLIVGQTACQ
jgi:hypothetical protein